MSYANLPTIVEKGCIVSLGKFPPDTTPPDTDEEDFGILGALGENILGAGAEEIKQASAPS